MLKYPSAVRNKTQNAADSTYFVSHIILHFEVGAYKMLPLSILGPNSPFEAPLLDKRLIT